MKNSWIIRRNSSYIFFRTFDLGSKVLAFDNKKKSLFSFVLFSLIRTFAP